MMDFTRRGSITLDELEILLFCVGTVSACVLKRNSDIPRFARVKELTNVAGDALNLTTRTSELNVKRFHSWSQEIAHELSTMNDVFCYFALLPHERTKVLEA